MSGPLPRRSDEIAAALAELRDGLIDEDRRARLDALLASDPEARRYYLEYIDLCVALRHYQGMSGVGEDRAPRRTKGPAIGRVLWVSAAAAALLAAISFEFRLARPGNAPVPVPAVAGPVAPAGRHSPLPAVARNIAVLARAIDPVWDPATTPIEVGSALPAGRLRLNTGLIQLEFYGGAIVVLEGPADFEPQAIDRALCRRGRLRVRAPIQSSHFSIVTPDADVVDLGTEFGLQVDEGGGSEVQVFEGSVELLDIGRGSAGKRLVAKGEGLRIDASGASRATEADPGSFVGTRQLQQRSSTEAAIRFHAWMDLSRKLQADPSVLVYYSFEGQQPWDRTLLDRTAGRSPRRDGGIVGCEWADGRWPGKAALDFKRTSDRVRVNIPGNFQALTLMTWVRVDDFDHRLNSLLLADGWAVPGEVHWELNGEGCLIFALKSSSRCDTPPVLQPDQLGRWTHLATVFAPRDGSITSYVNGRPVKSVAISNQAVANIGWADIGNWSDPDPSDPADIPIRNLNGRVDEFIIFDRALEAREVQSIHEVGRPTS